MEENTNMYLVLVPGFLLDNLVEAKKKKSQITEKY